MALSEQNAKQLREFVSMCAQQNPSYFVLKLKIRLKCQLQESSSQLMIWYLEVTEKRFVVECC